MTSRTITLTVCLIGLLLAPRAALAEPFGLSVAANIISYGPSASGLEGTLGVAVGAPVVGTFWLNTDAVERRPGYYTSPTDNAFVASLVLSVGDFSVRSSEWVDLVFRPGSMSIFFENPFAGPVQSSDTLYISALFDSSITSLQQLSGDTVFTSLQIAQNRQNGFSFRTDQVKVTSVPEPSTLWLVGVALFAAGRSHYRRQTLSAKSIGKLGV